MDCDFFNAAIVVTHTKCTCMYTCICVYRYTPACPSDDRRNVWCFLCPFSVFKVANFEDVRRDNKNHVPLCAYALMYVCVCVYVRHY